MFSKLIWLDPIVKSWISGTLHDRVPHAVLLAGPVGVGKRATAAWMASHKLSIVDTDNSGPVYPPVVPDHPDLHWICTPEDKQSIGIEQIRTLVDEFSLTSYKGLGKVGVIEPANDMTVSAANSLLKTLEEPPGDALLILIADRIGKLPATVFSRCQRIDFSVPDEVCAVNWLEQLRPGTAWIETLKLAGGGPIAAIDAQDSLETSSVLARDLTALGQDRGSVVEVAARWVKFDPAFVLDWLARQVNLAILTSFGSREQTTGLLIPESVLRHMDRRNLFWYLDIIYQIRGQARGSFNIQLTLEGLLIDWADRLRTVGKRVPTEGMELMRLK